MSIGKRFLFGIGCSLHLFVCLFSDRFVILSGIFEIPKTNHYHPITTKLSQLGVQSNSPCCNKPCKYSTGIWRDLLR